MMADPAELKSMVMTFRVSELQVLLGFAGRNKTGKKQELLARALQLVAKGCSTPVQIKIRELYRRRYPSKFLSPSNQALSPHHSDAYLPSYNNSMRTGGHGGSLSSYGGSSPPTQVPVHPDVRLKSIPFYDVLADLLKPASLVPKGSSRFQEAFFVFHLTPQQAQDIAMSRNEDIRSSSRVEFTVQVQLRFCLMETTSDQEDDFPPSICVRVNGKMAPLPNPIPTNKPGVEPKRPSRPVNITSICRISPTVPNHINVSWASEAGKNYCVAVYLVRRLTSDTLLQRLKQNGVRHPDYTRALIKEKLFQGPDSEIATTSLRVSLTCPVGKMRMTMPCRASSCNHLQCYDAPTFLQMNEKKPTWTCPVCDSPVLFRHLVIDGLFMHILNKCLDAVEIKFTEDGNWEPMKRQDEKHESVKVLDNSVLICDDSPRNPPSSSKSSEDVIDLTETDDEEDFTSSITKVETSSCSDLGSPRVTPLSSPQQSPVAVRRSSARLYASAERPESLSTPPMPTTRNDSSPARPAAGSSSSEHASLPSPPPLTRHRSLDEDETPATSSAQSEDRYSELMKYMNSNSSHNDEWYSSASDHSAPYWPTMPPSSGHSDPPLPMLSHDLYTNGMGYPPYINDQSGEPSYYGIYGNVPPASTRVSSASSSYRTSLSTSSSMASLTAAAGSSRQADQMDRMRRTDSSASIGSLSGRKRHASEMDQDYSAKSPADVAEDFSLQGAFDPLRLSPTTISSDSNSPSDVISLD